MGRGGLITEIVEVEGTQKRGGTFAFFTQRAWVIILTPGK